MLEDTQKRMPNELPWATQRPSGRPPTPARDTGQVRPGVRSAPPGALRWERLRRDVFRLRSENSSPPLLDCCRAQVSGRASAGQVARAGPQRRAGTPCRRRILQRDVRAKVAAARAELSARRKGAGRLERMQSTIRRLLDAETEWFALSAAMKRCTAATSARSPLRRRPRGFWSAASVARPSPYATGRPVGSPTREWMDTASTSTPPRARLVRV